MINHACLQTARSGYTSEIPTACQRHIYEGFVITFQLVKTRINKACIRELSCVLRSSGITMEIV